MTQNSKANRNAKVCDIPPSANRRIKRTSRLGRHIFAVDESGVHRPCRNLAKSRLRLTRKIACIGGASMKSQVLKRSIVIDGHKTSISLEDAFWAGLREIAQAQQATLSKLVGEIDRARQQGNLSSAIRLFVLEQVRTSGTGGVSNES